MATRNLEDEEARQEAAEHQAMGYKEYIALIARGAYEFDQSRMPFSYYEALAWNGIWEYSDFWGDLSRAEKNRVGADYRKAQKKLKKRTKRGCDRL